MEDDLIFETELRREAARLREAVHLSDEDLDRMLRRRRWTPREAMLLLRLLVEPICGSGTAGAAIQLAERRSTAGAEFHWSLFVANLSETMAFLCGAATGRLVTRVAQTVLPSA